MRLRSLPLTVLCVLSVAGCGAADGIKGSQRPEPCPADAPQLYIKDVLTEPPPGMEIVAADPASTKSVVDEFGAEADKVLRSVRSRAVVKRGRAIGTLVILLNTNERMTGHYLVQGARESADEYDVEMHELTIAGDEGVLGVGAEGAVGMGSVGDCAGIMLYAPTAGEVRAVAERIRRPE